MCDTGAGPILNLDIWTEIIRYYRIHDPQDAKRKKATLQSLALVSRHLTPLAQSEIWRTVHNIRHVVEYMDYVERSNIISGTCPKLLRQPAQTKTVERIREILSYTVNFILDRSSDLDFYNLEAIQMVVGGLHLFKNLKTLIIDWNHPNIKQNILPFLASPRIESITHRSLGSAPIIEGALLFFHGLLRMRNAPITSINLQTPNFFSPTVIPRLLHHAPNVSLNVLQPRVSQDDRFSTWSFAFSASANLTSLVFRSSGSPLSFWDVPTVIENEKYHLERLQHLELEGSTRHDFLLERLECPSLTNLTLTLRSKPEVGRTSVFSSAANFIQLEKLSVTFLETQPLSLGDLQPLLDSASPLLLLKIIGVTSQLIEADVESILSAKPSLRELLVYGPAPHILPSSTLFTIARYQLHAVCLPICLSEITFDNIRARTSTHPLARFYIPKGTILPESTKEKLELAEFIYHIFPSTIICDVNNYQSEIGQAVKDLEVMRAHISEIFETRM